MLNSAVEDGLIKANPANNMGRFLPADPEKFEPVALTREEAQSFLEAVEQVCPDFYLLFLTLLRTGLRWGQLAALRWGDIQFGATETIEIASSQFATTGSTANSRFRKAIRAGALICRDNCDDRCWKHETRRCSRLTSTAGRALWTR
jgi:integrase